MTTSSLNLNCRACGSTEVSEVLSLNPTPLEDNFTKKAQVKQQVMPLGLALCNKCNLLYLPLQVDPADSYENYIYKSSVTNGLNDHYKNYAEEIVNEYCISPNSLAVDIGSNDGTMLKAFREFGLRVLGVEPVKHLQESANKEGLDTINGFFTSEIANTIINEHGMAALVTANYMYANVKDLDDFTINVEKILKSDGIFVIQTGYHPFQFEKLMFDYIYHEHYYYFSLNFLVKYLEKYNLQVVNAVIVEPKGGSIRIICKKFSRDNRIHENVDALLNQELKNNINSKKYYSEFSQKLTLRKQELLSLLSQIKNRGQKIVGFGASHSTTTLLYHFELFEYIDYLVDDNEDKHGLYSPGYGIPVYPFSRVDIDCPAYIIILAWQHSDAIKKKHAAYALNGGKWITPLPTLSLI
jgi:2-polyprenyl-3-methyl-5-hydroxy-6-metoxy-1,4-benzoquinol methylase